MTDAIENMWGMTDFCPDKIDFWLLYVKFIIC